VYAFVQVPLFATSLAPHFDRILEGMAVVARSGRYIFGPELEAFEDEFAADRGVDHAVGVGDGTDLVERLAAERVQARVHYRTPVHRQPAMRDLTRAELPVTHELAATNVALPMGPELTVEQVEAVVDACRQRVSA
jgi:dTDP-4-amino-4,6-dideoxygalactose transaminase